MTQEQQILLDLVCGNDAIETDGCNWHKVFELSCNQGVAAVAFDRVQRLYELYGENLGVPTDVMLRWFAMQRKTEQRNQKVNAVLWRVVEVLEKHNVGVVLLKGQGLANLYDKPLHRQPGDIDLFVGSEKYAEAKKIISEQGWLVGENVHEDVKHMEFSVDGVAIELHYFAAILPGRKANKKFQELTLQALSQINEGYFLAEKNDVDTQSGVFVGLLPLRMNVVYTFIHMYRHFIDEGLSLRQLMDWSLLVRRLKANDFYEVRNLLREFGFLKPWQVLGCLLVSELGLKLEEVPCFNANYKKKAEKVLEAMFKKNNHQSRVVRHADSLGDKFCVLGDIAKNFNRVFWIFPKDYVAFTWLLLRSALKKNLGFIH